MMILTQGRVISLKIHPSPLKLALAAARLGGQPSLMINDLLPAPLRVGKGGARYTAVPRLRARD